MPSFISTRCEDPIRPGGYTGHDTIIDLIAQFHLPMRCEVEG